MQHTRFAAVAAASAVIALASGCNDDATAQDAPAQTSVCHTGNLRGAAGPDNAASGTIVAPIELTNVTDTPCTMNGYASVWVTDTADPAKTFTFAESPKPLGGEAFAADPQLVTLQPGGTAHFVVVYTNRLDHGCIEWNSYTVALPDVQGKFSIPASPSGGCGPEKAFVGAIQPGRG